METSRIDGFEIVMNLLPDGKLLEVGAAGMEGDNTTDYLVTRYKDYTGICIRPEKVAEYKELHPEVNILVGDYREMDGKYDIIVLDLNIDRNLDTDWTETGLVRMHSMLNPGGFLVNYVMMTTEYGDDDTPAKIAQHAKEFWGELTQEGIGKKLNNLKKFEYYTHAIEQRRPYILWVALKRTDG